MLTLESIKQLIETGEQVIANLPEGHPMLAKSQKLLAALKKLQMEMRRELN